MLQRWSSVRQGRTRAGQSAPWLAALLVAGVMVGMTIRLNTFSPWGTDQAGYIEAGHRWATGTLVRPAPLHFWPRWQNIPLAVTPFAFRPGAVPGTEVGIYPLGFPVLIAAAIRIGGDLAAYLVTPFFAGVLVLCVFSLGRRLSGASGGLLAAVLVAASPVPLLWAVMPMSDLPGAALWMLSLVMALGGGLMAAMAAGLLAAIAIMVRPNLAPLVVVVLGLHLLTREGALSLRATWPRLGVLIAAAAIGPILVMWSQAALYGHPLQPGYVEWESFFRLEVIPENARMLLGYAVRLHTPLIFLGLAAPLIWVRRFAEDPCAAWVALALAGVAVLNFLLYLPYSTTPDIQSARFLMPAFTALLALLAAAAAHLASRLWTRSRLLALLPLVPVVIVASHPMRDIRAVAQVRLDQARVPVMGRYLREVLPPNAAVVTTLQGAAIAHFTGKQIIVLDQVDPSILDEALAELERRGYAPVFVVDQAMELPGYVARLTPSRYGRFDWRPRAVFHDVVDIYYLLPADLEPSRRGGRWPIDRLVAR